MKKSTVCKGFTGLLLWVFLLALAGCGGGASSSQSVTGSDSDQNPSQGELNDPLDAGSEDPGVDAANGGQFALDFAEDRIELIEGDSHFRVVSIGISRQGGHSRPVQLWIEPAAEGDASDVITELDHSSLVGDRLYTSWRIRLAIGSAPLLPHQRSFQVYADDGVQQFSRTIIMEVVPVVAPDVYLLIGQSNMEGFTELGSRQLEGPDSMHPRIRQLNVRQNNRELFASDEKFTDEQFNVMQPQFVGAEDPLHEPRFSEQPGKGGMVIGPGLSFAKAALVNTTQEILLVPAAWSATGFCANADPALAWNARLTDESAQGGTLLTERALTRLRVALRDSGGIFRGVLWHQGEADSNTAPCAERYEQSLMDLVRRIRTDAYPDARGSAARGADVPIPFVLGTMSRGDDDRGAFSVFGPSKQRVDNAHHNIPNRVPYTATAQATDLVPPAYPCGEGSCIHFGAAAQRELGHRYYLALQRALQNHLR